VICLLDTHTWIWWHTDPDRLSAKVRRLIGTPSRYQELLLSAISPWEFCQLVAKGRLEVSQASREWVELAMDLPKLRLVPLTPTIACDATTLPAPLHDDPADRIIIATARAENATVLTKDRRLHDYPHVRALW